MSEFKQGSLRLRDNKSIYFGTDLDASITFNSATDTLVFDATTFSGLPTTDLSGYYTSTQVDTISGALNDKIISETKSFGNNWQITVSGTSLIFQTLVAGDWVTKFEIDSDQ